MAGISINFLEDLVQNDYSMLIHQSVWSGV